VQTAGQKQYFFRENTVMAQAQKPAGPDFAAIRHETSPLYSCTLEPGDWLHLPRGMWHVAKPLEDSLSLSLGVLPERPSRVA
jgi:ribosomal protein L16 Arg81 hydroxylase